VKFYVGIHQPSDAKHLGPVFVSVTRLSGPRGRKTKFTDQDWILDSGAFTTLLRHGGYPDGVEQYAAMIRKWSGGGLVAAVAQDYMCEPFMLAKTGKTIEEHQRLTIERYDALFACDCAGVYIMPVLQGYAPQDYVEHLRQYGDRLAPGAYVGVGSVCKRNGKPSSVLAVLAAIKSEKPDLRLHGFGIKTTSIRVPEIRAQLYSADSMAWSFHARKNGRSANDWTEPEIVSPPKVTAEQQAAAIRHILAGVNLEAMAGGTPVLRQHLEAALRTLEFLSKHGVTVRSFMASVAEKFGAG